VRLPSPVPIIAVTFVIGLAIFLSPAMPQPSGISHDFSLDEVALVKDAGYRRGRYRESRPHSRYRYTARRPHHDSHNYRYFGADPRRYFGVGPGAYECVGYDCNW